MKFVKKIAIIIILLFLLMVWSGIVRNVSLGERSLGVLTEPVKTFSETLSNIKKTYTYIFKAPEYYIKTKDADALDINSLSYNLYGLYSYRNGDAFKIELKNFKDNTLKHEWNVPVNRLSEDYEVDGNDRLYPATLMQDFDIIVSCNERPGLLRMDSNSKEKWFNSDFIFHHAMNLDSIGNMWIPAVKHDNGIIVPMKVLLEGHTTSYRDDLIVKVDANTGETLYSKSLTDIFLENDLESLLNKSPYVNDPFHLNDIQPVLESSNYFKEGDLFLSFRSSSLVIQYRPSTNTVEKIIEGPFTFQHDVDIISPNSIAILNNNTIVTQVSYSEIEFKPTNQSVERKISHSNVLIYNFEEDTYRPLYEEHFIKHNIFTGAEGLYRIFPNGDMFFEEQGSGILWVINQSGVVLKTTLKSDIEGYHYLPNWTTTYLEDELNSLK
ncbi:arylsulfotransferase family protein [Xanthomarina spongicola]|uniref:Arylsulfotransferase ASST n=1 Tax=Xanthomarina spongicola TaxID=570520 RepID=A0A316DSD7_9FLAO|nr:arylsulfotransferase family protein [Xanthomarina spongicola]PWK20388.1 arylsulfotransferase ASST [Xanthomarina spongicola]